MRVLVTTTGSAGHLLPLMPFMQALRFRPRDAAPASPPPAMVCHGGFGTVLGALPDVDAAAAVVAEVAAEGAPVQG